jgi:uncharacterized protein (DUF58 family)
MNLSLRAYGLALFIVILGIAAQWAPHAVSAYWWKLFTTMMLAMLGLEYFHGRRYQPRFELTPPELSHLGLKQQLNLTLYSHYPADQQLAFYLPLVRGEKREPGIHQLRLTAQVHKQLTVDFIPVQLGTLAWPHIQLNLLGVFGLAWWSFRQRLNNQTRVIPDSLDNDKRHNIGNRHVGHKHQRRQQSGMELQGLREYHSGDALHAIDWKATARSRELKTRLFEEEQHLELIIAVDAGRSSSLAAGELTRLGHYCNIAARLAEKAMLHGDQIGLIVYAEELISAQTGLRGHQGLMRLRQTLGQLQPSQLDANPINAVMKIRSLAQQRALVVFLSDVDDGYAAKQLNQSLRLLTPKHYPLLAGITEQAVLDIHEATPRTWLDPYRLLSADELILNWRQLRIEMAQMGIPVITQAAARLDREVLKAYEQVRHERRV